MTDPRHTQADGSVRLCEYDGPGLCPECGASVTPRPESCDHDWEADYNVPVLDTNPMIVTYRCTRCGKVGQNDWEGNIA